MANRYVWNRYNVDTSYAFKQEDVKNVSQSNPLKCGVKDSGSGSDLYLVCFKNKPTPTGKNSAKYTGQYALLNGINDKTLYTSEYPWAAIIANDFNSAENARVNDGFPQYPSNGEPYNGTVYLNESWRNTNSFGILYHGESPDGSRTERWYPRKNTNSSQYYMDLCFTGYNTQAGSSLYEYEINTNYSQGSTNYGPVTSANSGAYPSNGSSGSNWYVYQGADNIDPASVTIPASIQGGTSIDITVTPSTGKKYGGTVSYTYQYRLNGSGWQALSWPTTATTQQLTVPKGTASVQVQVRAQDNLGFTSSTWVASETVAVTNNQPPTAPGSINVTNVVSGQEATITLTAATDPDGSIASYIYQRSVDSGMWQKFAQANTLTQTDTVSNSWGTVQYRACAVDNEGAQGPFATSTLYTVTSGLLVIGGPNPSLGELDRQFNLALNINVTGVPSLTDIDVQATLDGAGIYTGQVDSGGVATIPVDARVLYTGAHTIRVTVSHDDYEPATAEYTFTVPTVSMPDGGRALVGQTPDGERAFFYTTAQAVFCQGGTLADVLAALQGGSVAPLLEPVIKEAPPSGSYALSPGVLYDFTQADATALTFTFEAPAAGKAAAYHVMFKCGSTAATVTLPAGVKTPDGYVIEAGRVYELSILQNMLAYQSWGAS